MKRNLRKLWRVLLVGGLLLGLILPPAWAAEEDKVTGEAAVGVFSAYIWRGQELTRHSVVVQPSATVGYKGFTANLWGNLDTRPYSAAQDNHSANFTETDVTLSYTKKFGIVQAGVGYIYYSPGAAAPGGPDLLDSQEVFASVGVDTILSPTLTVYKEIDHYHQWYALLGISHTVSLHKKVGLKFAATASYLKSEDAAGYPKYDGSALPTTDKFNNFHDGTFSVSLPVAVTDRLTISPVLTYVFPLSEDAKNEMKGRGLKGEAVPSDRDSAFLYGGITASFTF